MANAETLEKGEIECFPRDLVDDRGRVVNAEVSAVVYDGSRLIMASDKPIPGPGRSSVFALDYDFARGPVQSSLEYLCTPVIRRGEKYEDFALTPDGAYVLATTGFDRIDVASADLDHYNLLILWPRGDPDSARVVGGTPGSAESSSVALRRRLEAVLGTSYFKIEGIAAVPSPQADVAGILLFGVRERGSHKQSFDYVSEIVAVPYRMESGVMHFVGEFGLVYDFVANECEDEVGHACGLSSLEYDPFGRRLFLLTSFEIGQDAGEPELGGYLWTLSLEDMAAGHAPELVRHLDGRPVVFANKAEGLAVLSADRLFVVFDNDRDFRLEGDRGRSHRFPNEAPYTLMKVFG